MAKSVVLYSLGNRSKVQKTRIVRSLYGYKDKSYHGQYEYNRPGLLSKIKHNQQTKTALIVDQKDVREVVKILKSIGITPTVFHMP